MGLRISDLNEVERKKLFCIDSKDPFCLDVVIINPNKRANRYWSERETSKVAVR